MSEVKKQKHYIKLRSDLLSILGYNLVFGGVFFYISRKKTPAKQQTQMFPAAVMGSRIFESGCEALREPRAE